MNLTPNNMKVAAAFSLVIILLALVPLAVAAPPGQGGSPYVLIDGAPVNQRTGPGIEYAIQGTHPAGTQLTIIGRNPAGSWWEVDSQYGAGWINGEYTLVYGNTYTVPVVTEYGLLARPTAIVIGYPIEARRLPNPGGQVIGFAPSEYEYPVYGRADHVGTNTTWWLVMTSEGLAWLNDEGVGIFGFASNVPIITSQQARTLVIAPVTVDGVVDPPAPTPVPAAPTVLPPPAPVETEAPVVAEPEVVAEPVVAAPPEEAPAEEPPVAPEPLPVYELRIAGDCYALPLVNFLLNRSPVYATGLDCSSTAGGRDSVLLGDADLSMAINETCGAAVSVPAALLFAQDGTAHTLYLCIPGTPNEPTQTFLNWLLSADGSTAIAQYQGIPDTNVPQYAIPYGG